jgi:hypothetical protein
VTRTLLAALVPAAFLPKRIRVGAMLAAASQKSRRTYRRKRSRNANPADQAGQSLGKLDYLSRERERTELVVTYVSDA